MKIHVIANPSSRTGNTKKLLSMVQEKFAESLVHIHNTDHPQHATEFARRAVLEGADTIVAAGGDGTVNEVLNGIVGTDVALGIIPTGTANDLASLYHIPTDAEKACDVILQRHLHCADVIRVNAWYYVTAGGIGLPSQVASFANTIKRTAPIGNLLGQILGSRLYILALLYALVDKHTRHNLLTIQEWNGGPLMVDALALMVQNQPFLGKTFLMSPGAVNDDGVFDICLIENPKSYVRMLSILLSVFTGRHIHSPFVKTWRAEELIVNAEKPLAFFGDGEICPNAWEFRIKILTRALKIVVPKAIYGDCKWGRI